VGAFIIGGLSAGLGFREWRVKIQEPQDELLQIQLDQARMTLARLKKEAVRGVDTTGVDTTERDSS
jgi:hypothetical protein